MEKKYTGGWEWYLSGLYTNVTAFFIKAQLWGMGSVAPWHAEYSHTRH